MALLFICLFSCSIFSYLFSVSWSYSLPLVTEYTILFSLFLICINSQRAYFSFCHHYCESGKEKKAKELVFLCNQYCWASRERFLSILPRRKGGVGGCGMGNIFTHLLKLQYFLFLLSVVVKSCLRWKRSLPSSWSKSEGFATLMWHFNKLGVCL